MVLSSGRCAPCSMASSIEDSTSRPSELRKRTLVLVLGQVVLTEPLRFRLGHPMDHSNAADSSLVASLPEMRTAHARMSIDGICVQVRGNVQLGVSLARNSIWRTSTKGEAHFCISRVRNAVNNKSGFAPLQILLGEHCRSHSLAELRWKGHWCSCTCSCSDAPSRASSCVSEVFCVSSSS